MSLRALPPVNRRFPGLIGAARRSTSRLDRIVRFPILLDVPVDGAPRPGALKRVIRLDTRQALRLVLLLALATGVVIAHRWWRARRVGERVSEFDSVAHPGNGTLRPQAGVTTSTSESALEAPGASRGDDIGGSAVGDRVAPASVWEAIAPQPARRREIERPARTFGRGPSVTRPSIPVARPSLPGRPGLHLPL